MFNVRNREPVDQNHLRAMGRQLAHRGPDEAGYFTQGPIGFGIHRLRVIDLVSGQQPMQNEDGSLTVVFNGEIYNYRQLRQSLRASGHQFRSQADTEVIVHLFEEHALSCPEQLDGIFAFALWDAPRQRMVLARDPCGVKPLYYRYDGRRLVFASELKAILAACREDVGIDPAAVSEYLSFGYVLGPRTIFQNIQQLPAGHILCCDASGITMQQYWDVQFAQGASISNEELEERLLTTLTDAVRRQQISDVPLGAWLSGGTDSSVVVALLAAQRTEPLHTFSVRFQEASYDESPFAHAVSQQYGTRHHEILCDPRDCVSFLPTLPYYADSLIADPSLVPTFLVAQVAREHVTVVLSGDGGDELFAGYPTYQADAFLPFYRQLPHWVRAGLEQAANALPPSSRKLSLAYVSKRFVAGSGLSPERAHCSWRTIFTQAEQADLLQPDFQQLINGADPFAPFMAHFERVRHWPEPLDRFQYLDIKTWLADDILVKVDRMSMAHSLEARVPLLDRALVEFAGTIPAAQRMRGLSTKYLLKRVAARLLPRGIVYRRKAGFLPNLASWFCHEWKELLGDTLSEQALRDMGWFRPEAVRRLVHEHWTHQQDHAFHLWNVLVLCWWHQAFVKPGWVRRGAVLQHESASASHRPGAGTEAGPMAFGGP